MDNQNQGVSPQQEKITVPPQPLFKKKKIIFLISLSLILILVVLFIPIPYYQSQDALCKIGSVSCPTKGWHLGPSLLQNLYLNNASSSSAVEDNVTIPSPTLAVANEIDGWQTYRNDDFGFEIKYPPDWDVDIDEKPNKKGMLLIIQPKFRLTISSNLYSQEELLVEGEVRTGYGGFKSEIITLSGVAANKMYDTYTDAGGLSTRIIFNHKGYGWFIYLPSDGKGNYGDNHQLLDQILSTFRFISLQPKQANFSEGEDVRISGTITKNNTKGMAIDIMPKMFVQTEQGTVEVSYISQQDCDNWTTADFGLKLKPGDKIEVFGKVMSARVDTCGSKKYYIKKI